MAACICAGLRDPDGEISPKSANRRSTSPNISPRDHRMSDFGNYRRDLAVLETSGNRIPQIQHNPPTALASPNQIAPWMSTNGSNGTPTSASAFVTSFYNDSSDNLSQGSALSPGFRPGTAFTGNTAASDSPADLDFGDERRPSVASVTTASSTGSKSSVNGRGGAIHKKLQTLFGEDPSGKDGSDTSLPSLGKEVREHRSHSFARSHRERNHSSATDITQRDRDTSPAPSRPRTPVPSSDVVPFLYQDSQVSSFCITDKFQGPIFSVNYLEGMMHPNPDWGAVPPIRSGVKSKYYQATIERLVANNVL
jgi:adenylate cyclase